MDGFRHRALVAGRCDDTVNVIDIAATSAISAVATSGVRDRSRFVCVLLRGTHGARDPIAGELVAYDTPGWFDPITGDSP